MFTQPAPPSPGLFPPLTPSTSSPATTTTSSARGSRLRGLIHLRSYHTSSRDPNSNNSNHNNRDSPTSRSAPVPSPLVRGASAPSTIVARLNSTATPVPSNAAAPQRPELSSIATVEPSSSSGLVTIRRRTTKYSEAAAEALLHSRSGSDPSAEVTETERPTEPAMTRTRSATTGDLSPDSLPAIRFSAFYDPRSTRPSLSFSPIARTLPTGKETIKVGRYSERENHAPVPTNTPSAAPVGFKSKVVSRRHCEFWCEKGKWYIKDVKSSSGTFLNHIRLSAPTTESKPYPINDGDIVQLGIDFKGGEEMIYRCVKMRIELNRGWQTKPNTFNMTTHKRLRDLTSASSSAHAQDCSICLNAIAPCQSLFVAPCSHTWHFKCIREMLHGPSWPIFMCPNCRATADLDAEVDEPSDDWQQLDSGVDDIQEDKSEEAVTQATKGPASPVSQLNGDGEPQSPVPCDMGDMTVQMDHGTMAASPGPLRHAATEPVPIPNATPRASTSERRTPSPSIDPLVNSREGPITPRNDAGPWVFDGNPARVSHESTRRNGMSSLDAAAQAGAKLA
ncbi:Uu.00g001570.m01.CDS01 [Anthostomella pinea]|uniref:RING-type E3 ubiquitin transferase n=1 Tax=Anthostomella pinea TaxID=933095 RepID=A0AAI8VJH5_9PEZI|nr:Uu.00g001570.m01.CDS01 [Anthostomella pinea]